jgi:peptidoglycan/LPS O-acetylase OafA/YrhL
MTALPQPTATPAPTHDASLDGLRGVAATIVVIHHYLLGLYPAMVFNQPETIKSPLDTLVATTPLNLLIGGHFAVCIFFVLSAHVLTKNHVANANGLALISAMAKRYPRLGIPVFVSVMISFLALCVKKVFFNHMDPTQPSTATQMGFNWVTSLKDALFEGSAGALLFGNAKFNPPLWTISTEFYGSMGIFAILLLLPSGRPTWRWVAYALLIPLTWETYYLAFILGMTLSELTSHPKFLSHWVHPNPYLPYFILIGGLFLGSVPMHHTDWQGTVYEHINSTVWRPAYHIAGAYLLVMSVIIGGGIKRMLSARPFKFLGEISFSMYLLHIVVIQYIGHKLIKMLSPYTGFHSAVGLMAILTFSLILMVSINFRNHVDKKAIQLSAKVGIYIKKYRHYPFPMNALIRKGMRRSAF